MTDVFAITGTNGKTTASYMLRNILCYSGRKTGLIGTITHQIGEEEYSPVNTTPGRQLLRTYFDKMALKGMDCCVIEASSHGLVQGRLDDTAIAYGAFTNLTQDHLDYHKTMEEYFRCKCLLFERSLRGGAVNIDDSFGRRIIELYGECDNLATVSLNDKKADYFGISAAEDITGQVLEIYIKGSYAGDVRLAMPGRQFAVDALIAIGLAFEYGIDFDRIKSGIETLKSVPGRWQLVWDRDDIKAIVDFAHTPDALELLLKTAGALTDGQIICIFGCGGERDAGKRFKMGEIAGRYSDYVIVTSDNPRGEDPEDITARIEEGVYSTGAAYSVIPDRTKAFRKAAALARKNTLIIAAGKGHEKYQIIGDNRLPFDDVRILKEFLEEKY